MHHEFGGKHFGTPNWPSYKGTSSLIGKSASGQVTVYVDPMLGASGLQNAQDLIADADRVAKANDAIFGSTGGPVNVIIFALGGNTDGTGGADHMGCDYTTGADIEVCAAFGNANRVSALFEAELSECSMGGQLCGQSTGEALSRWCAAVIGHNALADFATAPTWFNDGMQDFVNQTDPTDQNADSTGCGMAFLSWLMSRGFGLEKIAPAMVALGDGGTFAQLYNNLTSTPPTQAWDAFQAAIQALPNGIANDDPFGAMSVVSLSRLKQLDTHAVALAGKIFASILADIASGSAPEKVVQNVRTLMGGGTPGMGGACRMGSRRLLPPKAR